MNLVGKHLRQGVTVGGEKKVEYITVLEEKVVSGVRMYRIKVLMENKGCHRMVMADAYERMFTPQTTVKKVEHSSYKGDAIGTQIRQRDKFKN